MTSSQETSLTAALALVVVSSLACTDGATGTPGPELCQTPADCSADAFCARPELVLTPAQLAQLLDAGQVHEGDRICAIPGDGLCRDDDDCEDGAVCAPGEQLYYGAAWERLTDAGFPVDAGQCRSRPVPSAEDRACAAVALDECAAAEGCTLGSACDLIADPEDPPPADGDDCLGVEIPTCVAGEEPVSNSGWACSEDFECGDRLLCVDGACALDPAYDCSSDPCADGEVCTEVSYCASCDENGENCVGCVSGEQCASELPEEECFEDAECVARGRTTCVPYTELLSPEDLARAVEQGANPDAGICM
ncbi:MAG: hypothetical protein IT383_12305 [Deltaproteobacteria bacterium]|nr:hypothetical protein [Deltaproteobacteria bacterium]